MNIITLFYKTLRWQGLDIMISLFGVAILFAFGAEFIKAYSQTENQA